MDEKIIPHFSFFKRGYMQGDKAFPQNRPSGEYTLQDVYRLITSDSLRNQTLEFRNRGFGKVNASRFKIMNFPTVTFSATFTYRNASGVKEVNNLLVLDFDDVPEGKLRKLWASLLKDRYFEPLLQFVSPSGNGIKSVIEIKDWCDMGRAEYFNALSNYIWQTHGHRPDPSGKDVTRLCFLCYDPNCYINPSCLSGNE